MVNWELQPEGFKSFNHSNKEDHTLNMKLIFFFSKKVGDDFILFEKMFWISVILIKTSV